MNIIWTRKGIISFVLFAFFHTGVSFGGVIRYEYDALNRLKLVSGGALTEYSYDQAGNRISYFSASSSATKTEITSLPSGGNKTITISNVGGAGSSYEWYRNGAKISTTNTPSLAVVGFSPQNAGSYRVIIRETNGSITAVELMVKLTGLTYESWLQHKQGPTATPSDPGLSKMATPREDGFENILKYALGKGSYENTGTAQPESVILGEGAAKRSGIKFHRLIEPLDISIKVEASGDMASWRDVTNEMPSLGDPTPSPDGITEQITLQCPLTLSQPGAETWKFLRIAIQDLHQEPVVLFADDFQDGEVNPALWTVFGNAVQEEGGILKILTNQTDAGGLIVGKAFPMPENGLQFTRKAMLRYSNSYAMPSIRISYSDAAQQDVTLFSVVYGNMSYNGGVHQSVYGTFLGLGNGNPHSRDTRQFTVEGPPVLWETWFDERLSYHRSSGQVRYFRNGEELISGNAPSIPAGTLVYMKLDAWGWYTGHWHYCDDLIIRPGTQ